MIKKNLRRQVTSKESLERIMIDNIYSPIKQSKIHNKYVGEIPRETCINFLNGHGVSTDERALMVDWIVQAFRSIRILGVKTFFISVQIMD